jgi:hypothetical protein
MSRARVNYRVRPSDVTSLEARDGSSPSCTTFAPAL